VSAPLPAVRGPLYDNACQLDQGPDADLAEYLARVEGDGMHAEEYLVRDLLIRQPSGNQVRNAAFGAGKALPAGRPKRSTSPVAAPASRC
jgi:hypothetical protein